MPLIYKVQNSLITTQNNSIIGKLLCQQQHVAGQKEPKVA